MFGFGVEILTTNHDVLVQFSLFPYMCVSLEETQNRLPKKKLNYKSEERRNIGRPQTRWEDDFRKEGTGQGA